MQGTSNEDKIKEVFLNPEKMGKASTQLLKARRHLSRHIPNPVCVKFICCKLLRRNIFKMQHWQGHFMLKIRV